MPSGTLHVLLVRAKGLQNMDYIFNMDPYAILTCNTQKYKSGVASGMGSEPQWNEPFVFSISGDSPELKIKLFDSDTGTEDDFVGQTVIDLEPLFIDGTAHSNVHRVVKDEEYCGEIEVELTFTPKENQEEKPEEIYGGWKQSS